MMIESCVELQVCWTNKQGNPWWSDSGGAQGETGIVSICSLAYHCWKQYEQTSTNIAPNLLQAKAMQDPEIQNILTDPVMRQVQYLTLLIEVIN